MLARCDMTFMVVLLHCSDLLCDAACKRLANNFVLGGFASERSRVRDLRGNELGVLLHPPQQGGTTRVLPRQPEEVETGDVCDSAEVPKAAAGIQHGKVDPGMVMAVS